MTPEQQQAVAAELKRFAADLNLSDAQKAQLKTALEGAVAKADELQKSGKKLTPEEIATIKTNTRANVQKWLTPEQLVKWDAEVAKAKGFLGMQAA
jgi:hypothetical protein